MFRTLWVYLVGLAVTPVYAWRAIRIGRSGDSCGCEDIARRWSRILLRAAGVTVEVEGAERFDKDAAHIMVANHSSWFDVFALAGYLPAHFRFVAKQELSKIPIFGRAWLECGHISIDRSDRQAAVESLDLAGERIRKENLDIVLFAEGTRSPDGKLQRFKKGAFVLALKAGVPVVPVAIMGTRDVMPKGRWRVRAGKVQIRIGDPISVEGMTTTDRDRLLETTWHAVAALKGEPATPDRVA